MRILSAGISEIDPNIFKDSSYEKIMDAYYLNKPRGFLWGSTLIKINGCAYSDWIRFVEGEQFICDKYSKGISYTLNKNSKVLTINDIEDYKKLMEKYYIKFDGKRFIDFSRLSKDYDAFHLSDDAFCEMRLPLYRLEMDNGEEMENFYSYDCETWIIFNLDCINKGSILNHCIPIKIDDDYYDDEV